MDVQAVAASTGVSQQQAPAQVMGSAPAADAASQGTQHLSDHHKALSDTIARLFGEPSQPQSVSVNVSYRVSEHPSQIVTVFSDPQTGEEIAQFPADLLVQIAQFFDKQSGVTLDRSA